MVRHERHRQLVGAAVGSLSVFGVPESTRSTSYRALRAVTRA